jgi:phospholipid N-methyltransferase
MKASHLWRRSLLTLSLSLAAASVFVHAQTATQTFTPEVGQPGKDVVWVPTPQTMVDKMLDMAKVTAQDFVIDLGSGDGRTVITAAKRGARAQGIEYNPDMVALSQRNAAAEGMSARATFAKADLFESDFSQASVITMFLLPEINLRLRPKILDLKPGTRIVSNTFTMDDWSPDETAVVGTDCSTWCTALFWIVPAKVEGAWQLPQGTLNLRQRFQMISGTLSSGNNTAAITSATLRGDQISFSAAGVQYTGRVNGSVMQGTTGTGASWRATRAGGA